MAACSLVSALICLPASVLAVQPKISAGGKHAVYLKADGSLFTWGSNSSGELGGGPPSISNTPKQIGMGFISAAAGWGHSVAVKNDGSLWGWGAGGGLIGDGTTGGSWTPKKIGNGFTSVAAGGSHSLALKPDGSLWAWGANFSGELGDGTKTQSLAPKQIGTGFASVSICGSQSFAKKTDGTFWAWGQGPFIDGTVNSTVPKSMGSGYAAMTCNFAIKTDGTLWGWGSNYAGQLGDGTVVDATSPKLIGSGFTDVTTTYSSTLAIKADGSLWSWGFALGTTGWTDGGDQYRSLVPRQIGTGFVQLSSANGYAVALKADATVWGWGLNGSGQIGNGRPTDVYAPQTLAETTGNAAAFTFVAAGPYHSVGIKADDTMWAWGLNRFGQLCCNTERSNIAKLVGSGYVTAAAGMGHTLAIKRDGTLWAWGLNYAGQLGDGTRTDVWIPKLIGSDYSQVATAYDTSFAIKTDGSLWGWGRNINGELGNGTINTYPNVPLLIGTGFTKVVSGGSHTAALKSDGSLWTWGINSDGQLGDGSPSGPSARVLLPVQIGTGFTDVAAGLLNTAAIKADGSLWAWGSALPGGGSQTGSNVPKQIGTGFTRVAVGYYGFAAVKADGSLWTWGIGDWGSLGQNRIDLTRSATPVQIGIDFETVAASATGVHRLAIKKDGTVWAWGGGGYGQLGNGVSDPLQPVQVTIPQTLFDSPTLLTVSGAETLQSGGRTNLTATAQYADNRQRTIVPVWSSSNPVAAAVSASGVVTAGVVSTTTQVTISASWTENGVTVQDSQVLTVSAAPSALTDLRLTGASNVQSGGQVRLVLNAVYADQSSKVVAATGFTLSNPALGSVNTRGVLTVANVTSNTALTVTATYDEGGVTKSASLPITISAAPAVLSRLTLVGASALVASGQTLNLSALGVYADTSSKPVVATWQVIGTAATVSSTGVFKASTVSADTPVVVSASYTEAGVTVNAQFQVIIQATVPSSPIQAEVQATGTSNSFSLAIWTSFNAITPNGATSRAGTVKSTGTGRATYKLFVVALIPGGQLVPVDTIVTLNRNSEWQGLSFPVAEYLNGVADNSVQLVEIFDKLDVSIISGSKIYVGYGIDDQEMIASRRFRLVYQIQ